MRWFPRDFFVDWDEATDVVVSGLCEAAGSDPDDPRLRALDEELSGASARFRELWAPAEVGYRTGVIHMRHPDVTFTYTATGSTFRTPADSTC